MALLVDFIFLIHLSVRVLLWKSFLIVNKLLQTEGLPWFLCVFLQSPQYSSGSYDSIKMEICPEDLTVGRPQAADDDDDDHDDHDDNDKINDVEGVDPERLKAFNVSIRTFNSWFSRAVKHVVKLEFLNACFMSGFHSHLILRWSKSFLSLFLDVCASLCGWEPGPYGTNL